MKKFILTALLLVVVVLSSMAKKEYIHAFTLGTEDWTLNYLIDRSEMMFYFDGEVPEETEMVMKNYKKSGNTETFDIYAKYGGKKVGSVVLTIDPSLKAKDDLSGQTITVKAHGRTEKYNVMTEKQAGAKDSASGKGENIVDKAKGKTKDLFNKGKDLFKKKK